MKIEGFLDRIVSQAIEDYQNSGKDVSLTGNLINSIAGAFFIGGKPYMVKYASQTEEGQNITHTYTFVGDKRGFRDYDTGEYVSMVYPYNNPSLKFKRVPLGGTGLDSAMDFFGEYKPKCKYEIVVVAAAPYAEFLRNERKLNVLTTAKMEGDSEFDRLIHDKDTYKL